MASDTSSKGTAKLTARVGSRRLEELDSCIQDTDLTRTDATKRAIDNYIKEQQGERIEHIRISRLSAWDMYSLALYSMAGLSAVLTLAGFDMLIYAVGFTAMGLLGWVGEARFGGSGLSLSEVEA